MRISVTYNTCLLEHLNLLCMQIYNNIVMCTHEITVLQKINCVKFNEEATLIVSGE